MENMETTFSTLSKTSGVGSGSGTDCMAQSTDSFSSGDDHDHRTGDGDRMWTKLSECHTKYSRNKNNLCKMKCEGDISVRCDGVKVDSSRTNRVSFCSSESSCWCGGDLSGESCCCRDNFSNLSKTSANNFLLSSTINTTSPETSSSASPADWRKCSPSGSISDHGYSSNWPSTSSIVLPIRIPRTEWPLCSLSVRSVPHFLFTILASFVIYLKQIGMKLISFLDQYYTKKWKCAKTGSTNFTNCDGHPLKLRSCLNVRVKCELICIIALSLCPLSPSLRPVITSNAIFPMYEASSVDHSMNGELSIPVEGVVGKRVELPCDITPSRRDDSVYMVLWFRGEESIPIYSLDVRGKHVGGGKPWSADKPFGKRAYFQSTSEPARLIVEGGRVSDHGIYRCRVDFRNSPSREVQVNLSITVPPNEPQIYDTTGMSIRGEVGPFLEGATVELTCSVQEGIPSPMVQWYLNDELVDSSYHVKSDNEVVNHISVQNLQRKHHRASLSCKASNTLLVPPVTKTVFFELNLRPISVSIPIKHRNPQLTVETQYEIKCESWGSHPPPIMSWWLDGREETGASVEEDSRGSNNSVSRLLFTPNASVDGQVLLCRAENPHVTAGVLEDSWRLRVVYPPMLQLQMGSSLNPRDIKEGDDVYFECHIRANPQAHKLLWYHNGLLLHHNRSAGVILSNQSLVLQKVSRPSAGNYSCRASNAQGEGTSDNVLLDIMYVPSCQTELSATDAPIIITASRSENVNITCEMNALPDKLKFQWTHTNTVGENSELEQELYSTLGSRSFLRYHLRSEEDFGTVLCWAQNSIGIAEKPCVYQLVPADNPQPVENCSIINRTSSSVEISCEPGFDGGLPQNFLLEAYQTSPLERRGLLSNLTQDRPSFSLSGLDAEGTFHFKIYAVNRKGRSSAVVMDGIILSYPAMQSAKVQELEKTTVAIIIGAVSAIILGVVSLIAFIVERVRNPVASGELEKSYSQEFGLPRRSSGNEELHRDLKNSGVDHIPFTSPTDFPEEGDPDLIPSSRHLRAAAMGSVFSKLSNSDSAQRYSAAPEKIPLQPLEDLPSYSTALRGNPNSFGLQEDQEQRQHQQARLMMGTPPTDSHSHQVISSPAIVNLDTRLICEQLATKQLPQSSV